MIPKIAHFHWSGPPMSWLRLASIATFKKHNPGWEIRLHDTPEDLRFRGLTLPQQADWTWWRALRKWGGFQVASDIVFVRPIPNNWLDCTLTACLNGQDHVVHNAAMGATKGHPWVVDCEDRCIALAEKSQADFQAFGPTLLEGSPPPKLEFVDQPMTSFCSVPPYAAHSFWREGANLEEILTLPEVIGFHWYGGHDTSLQHEREALPGTSFPIVQIADRELRSDDPLAYAGPNAVPYGAYPDNQ